MESIAKQAEISLMQEKLDFLQKQVVDRESQISQYQKIAATLQDLIQQQATPKSSPQQAHDNTKPKQINKKMSKSYHKGNEPRGRANSPSMKRTHSPSTKVVEARKPVSFQSDNNENANSNEETDNTNTDS